MRIYLDCIPCFIRQSLDAARLATEDVHVHEQVVRGVIGLAKDLDMSQSPPVIGQQIHRLIRQLIDVEDPYHSVKQQFNNAALKLYSRMRNLVSESKDPLEAAVRIAIAGNIIDFGLNSQLQEKVLEETIDKCLFDEHAELQIEAFRIAINEAEEILYLTDNAGEISL